MTHTRPVAFSPETRIIGIELVALDVVVDDTPGRSYAATAGGSCGTILAIFAWLGWDAAPIARLDAGANATVVGDDLERHGVDTGLRIGETVALDVDDVTLSARKGVVTIRGARVMRTARSG